MNHQDTTCNLIKEIPLYNKNYSLSMFGDKIIYNCYGDGPRDYNGEIWDSIDTSYNAPYDGEGIIIRDRKTMDILYHKKDVKFYEKVEINDRYLVFSKNDFTGKSIEIIDYRKGYENNVLSIPYDYFYQDSIFSLDGNRIGYFKRNTLYNISFSVFNLETQENEFECSIRKTDYLDDARDWYFRYQTPCIKIFGDKMAISIGSNICYLYDIPTKKLIKTFEINELINGLLLNSEYIVLLGMYNNPCSLYVFNYKTDETFKFQSYMRSCQSTNSLDISEDYIVFVSSKGGYEAEWIEIFDLKTRGIYKQKIRGKFTNGEKICIDKNNILVSSFDRKEEKSYLQIYKIENTPKKETLLAIYQKKFGEIGENRDIRKYILEFFYNNSIKKIGNTFLKGKNFILHEKINEIPRIEIYYSSLHNNDFN